MAVVDTETRSLIAWHIAAMSDYTEDDRFALRGPEITAHADGFAADLAECDSDSQLEELLEAVFDIAVNVYDQFTEDEFYSLPLAYPLEQS